MSILSSAIAFAVLCLASYIIGKGFKALGLPTITGDLFAGALAGSFGVDMIASVEAGRPRFVDEISLAVIAFVAGSELAFLIAGLGWAGLRQPKPQAGAPGTEPSRPREEVSA